jgi:hypothetical protein
VTIAVAAVTAYGLAEALGLTPGYWAVFTTVIVVQASVAGSLSQRNRRAAHRHARRWRQPFALAIADGNAYLPPVCSARVASSSLLDRVRAATAAPARVSGGIPTRKPPLLID